MPTGEAGSVPIAGTVPPHTHGIGSDSATRCATTMRPAPPRPAIAVVPARISDDGSGTALIEVSMPTDGS